MFHWFVDRRRKKLTKTPFCLYDYSMFAPTTAAISIMLIVWPSFRFVRSVTLPDLLLDFVFLKIGSNLASATMNLPAFSGFPFSAVV